MNKLDIKRLAMDLPLGKQNLLSRSCRFINGIYNTGIFPSFFA
jgi:hypothetical protein